MNNNWFSFFAEQKKKELLEQENNFINNIINLVKIDYYELLKKIKCDLPHNNLNINIIIPVKGRGENLKMVVNRFLINLKKFNNINITVVENNEFSEHEDFCKKYNLNYIWIPLSNSGKFNKSLCMNFGAMFVKSDSYLFHDVDLIFSNTFLEDVLNNYDNKVVQCFSEKNIFTLDEVQTRKVLLNEINVEELFNNTNYLISKYNSLPPGGSILINSELFSKIGGFDDNIFEGWGHEDAIFKLKIKQKFDINIPPCKSPIVGVIHLYHPIETENNINLKTLNSFVNLTDSTKNKIILSQFERFEKLNNYIFNNL